jgi:hypothetical protein
MQELRVDREGEGRGLDRRLWGLGRCPISHAMQGWAVQATGESETRW